MGKESELTAFLAGVTQEWLTEHGRQARARAEAVFSTQAVVHQYIRYYEMIPAT
jgi:hypothetical protein